MSVFIAILPILSIFILLFFLKQSAVRAALFAYLITILITITYSSFQLGAEDIMHSTFRGALISFIAAYVLFFGILLYHLINSVGGIQAIASFIQQATNDRIIQVLILTVGLSPLIESTSGFGVAFMVVAPIFLALGFKPLKAALLGLVSLLAVPWGALATGTVIGSELGGISIRTIGIGTAFVSIPVFIYFILLAVYIAGGFQAIKEKWKEIMLFSFIFSVSILLINLYVSVELAGVLASLITTGLGLMIVKFSRKENKVSNHKKPEMSILKVMCPYIILTTFIFISRLITPIREFLETNIAIDIQAYSYYLALLYSPGFWLFVTCFLSVFIFKIKKEQILFSLDATLKQWIPFAISTVAFVSISEIMTAAGMTNLIANSAGTIFGGIFLIISGFIGGLGGFLTGSSTGSNAMFINLQTQTAGQIGMSKEIVAFVQNSSAAHITLASPSRILLAATLLNVKSKENYILTRISLIGLGAIALIVIMAYVLMLFL